MSKHLVLLPGWGLGVVPLQILAEQLDAALPQLTVQIQSLPDVRGKSTEALIALLDQQLPTFIGLDRQRPTTWMGAHPLDADRAAAGADVP